MVGHFSSVSVVASLEEEKKKSAQASFRAVLDDHFKDEEEIAIPFQSEFYCVEKPK